MSYAQLRRPEIQDEVLSAPAGEVRRGMPRTIEVTEGSELREYTYSSTPFSAPGNRRGWRSRWTTSAPGYSSLGLAEGAGQ